MAQHPMRHGTGTTGGIPSESKQIFQDDYFTVLVDERMGIVRTIRSDKPFPSIEELDAIFARLFDALDGLDRPRYVLLSDARAGPGRNDPEFETALHRLRPRWLGGFRKVGVLVRSVVGMMQVQRYARQDGIPRLISNDENEILQYLTRED